MSERARDLIEELNGFSKRMHPVEWVAAREAAVERALASAESAAVGRALAVGSWTAEESDGMLMAFDRAKDKHGARETLFAVGAWLLRHRLEKSR